MVCILNLRHETLEYGKRKKNKNPALTNEICSHSLGISFFGFLKFGRDFLKSVSKFPPLSLGWETGKGRSWVLAVATYFLP